MPRRQPRTEPLCSAAGVALTREVAFRFALDPTREQQRALLAHAGQPGWRSTTTSRG
jgi:hypothetical protein